jgi:hypothetical protein
VTVLELARVDRVQRSYPLAPLFPTLAGPFTTASLALVPPRTSPTGSTTWATVGVTAGAATPLFAGPDASPSGAFVVTGSADVWIQVTVGSETDAVKVERVTLLGGGVLMPSPTAALDAALFTVLNDPTSASYARVEALIAARAGFGGLTP